MKKQFKRGAFVINKFYKKIGYDYYGIILSYNEEMDAYKVAHFGYFREDWLASSTFTQYWFSEDISLSTLTSKKLGCEPFLLIKYRDLDHHPYYSPYNSHNLLIESGFTSDEAFAVRAYDYSAKNIQNGDICKLKIPVNNREIIGIVYNSESKNFINYSSSMYFIYQDENDKIVWSFVMFYELELFNCDDKTIKDIFDFEDYEEWTQDENFRYLYTRDYVKSLREYVKKKNESLKNLDFSHASLIISVDKNSPKVQVIPRKKS